MTFFITVLFLFFAPRLDSLNVDTDGRRWAGPKGRLDKSGENFYLVHLNKEQVCRKQPLRCKHVAQNCEFDCQGREIPDVRRAPRLGRNGK